MTGSNPTDRGKLEKRHVLTDQNGIALSVTITSANTHDMKAARNTLDSVIVRVIASTCDSAILTHIPHRGEGRTMKKDIIIQQGGGL